MCGSIHADTQPLSSGIRGLDLILRGGLTRDRVYLVEGHPGSGKTTLAIQFLLEGKARDERVLYVTLSETRRELAAVAASHGWVLDGVEVLELVVEPETLDPDSQLTMFHSSELELGETTRRILAEVERLNPARVVIDSLSEMRLLAQSPLRFRRQILALKQFFMGRGCSVLLLDDPASDSSEIQLQSIAHGVIGLEQLAPEYGGARRRLSVIKMRGKDYPGGFHDFAIRRGGIQVFPRLIAAEHPQDFSRDQVRSGVDALDALLGGGLEAGTSTLIVGPAGSGKSTLAAQYAVEAAAEGDRAAMFIFDETTATLQARCEAIGLPLQERVQSGRLWVQQVNPAELSPGEFIHIVRSAVEPEGGSRARVVVIDSLNGFLNSMPGERFLAIQLHELLSYLAQHGVATVMVMAQHGIVGSRMTAPVDTSYLADAVVLLRFFEAQGRVRRAISVIKKRSGHHEDTIREFSISAGGITLGAPLSEFEGILTGVPRYVGAAAKLA